MRIALNHSKGFTLIELIVIIAMMGIVSTLGYISFTSQGKDTKFLTKNTQIKQYLSDIRFKAYNEGLHHKVRIENSGSDLTLKTYTPETNLTSNNRQDLNLNRRCNCVSGTSASDTSCNNSFSTSVITSLSSITNLDKTITGLNAKVCSNANCTNESNPPIELCFLFDGTSPQADYFKITGEGQSKIYALWETGYVD
jgi:prepilin-type N-terminal cleavage/methylation domain-containing protein